MTEKFVRETLKNYREVDVRARHIAELINLSGDWIDSINFDNENEITYIMGDSYCGYIDYETYYIPLKYLWMNDEDILKDYEEMKRKEREEQLMMEKVREEAKQAAMEREERATYERLKAKFENE